MLTFVLTIVLKTLIFVLKTRFFVLKTRFFVLKTPILEPNLLTAVRQ